MSPLERKGAWYNELGSKIITDIERDKVASKILDINLLEKIIVISSSEVKKLQSAFDEIENVVEIVQKGFSPDVFVKKIKTGKEK